MSTVPYNLDLLIEGAAVEAGLASGHSLELVRARSKLDGGAIAVLSKAIRPGKSAQWTLEEDRLLRASLGVLRESEIAAALGRSITAVHLRWKRDLRLPAPSKDPRQLTGEQVANLLGLDGHGVAHLYRLGLLPLQELPTDSPRVIRSIDRRVFLRWVINPMHWCYFKREKVTDPYLRRLLELKAARWGDEWWRIGQVARYHGVRSNDVTHLLYRGCFPPGSVIDYGNYWFLRSAATDPSVKFYHGKGCKGIDRLGWTDAANAYIVLARAVGMPHSAIGRNLGRFGEKQLDYHTRQLHERGQIPAIIKRYGLRVQYNRKTGALFADWHTVRARFPGLVKALERFAAGQTLKRADVSVVRGVLRVWAARHLAGDVAEHYHRSLYTSGGQNTAHYRAIYRELQALGVDPLVERR